MNPVDLPLHFLRPWWWLALLPLPVVLWKLAHAVGDGAALARLADATLLPYLVQGSGARRRTALALVALAWLLAVAALTGPAWQKLAAPLYVNGATRVVALSLSDDMLARDLQPDRMARARFAVRDLLDDAGDARTALVAYAGAAFTVAPLTDDKRTVLNLLRALRPDVMPVPGNDAAAGIRKSVQLLEQAHAEGGEIVLVTDTADTVAVAAARAARARGIRVDVLGIGTPEGAPVPNAAGGFVTDPAGGLLMARRNDAALRAVASAGGGRCAVLQADGSGVAALGAPRAQAARASNGERAQVWRDGGIWLLPVLLVVAALGFRRGWLLVLAVLVLPIGMPAAHAATWDSLWANRDQRAVQALRQGDLQQAKRLATSPGVRGAADYRAGDYAGAARAFAAGSDARARYNLGNALAREGKYPQAVSAYREALQREPRMADARANLAAVEDWMKRHPKPQQGQAGKGQAQASGSKGGNSSSGSQDSGPPRSSASGESRSPSHSGSSGAPQSSGAAQPQGSGAAQSDRSGPSASEAARQRREVQRAKEGLTKELHAAGQDNQPAQQQAFALGANPPQRDGRLDAQQRALLRSVPDDPGALLRRKFLLEWEERNGQTPSDGQPR